MALTTFAMCAFSAQQQKRPSRAGGPFAAFWLSYRAHQLLERLVQAGGGQAADHAGQDGAGIEGGPVGPVWCR